MSEIAITFLVLAGIVVVFVLDRVPVAIVAIGTPLILWAAGILDLGQSLEGFGDPAVLFIASLFVISEALDAAGVPAWVGQELIARAGTGRGRVIAFTLMLVAAATALINVNAAVAAVLPLVVVMAVRLRWPPSQLLMPVAFTAHAGSLLTLTGTPVNVIVSEAAEHAGVGRFGFFEFGLVGIPLVIGTIAFIVLFGERLLPHRTPRAVTRDFSEHARALIAQYDLDHAPDALLTRTLGAAEVVIPPRSALIGSAVYPGMLTDSGDLVILAVQRKGEELPGGTELAVGDTMLVQGTWGALDRDLANPSVLVVDQPQLVRRQAVPMGAGAKRAIGVLLTMVILLATGVVPAAVAGLLGASAMVLLGVLTVGEAYRAVSWTTVILVGGMISLSTAMVQTGAAERMADGLVWIVGDAGPYALLLGLFVLTAILGQLISNMATALIVIPVAVSAAAEMGVSARPVLMAVSVAAAASFLTPVATPANLMIKGPGDYRFGDYWKLGLPLLALFGVVAVLLVPLFWSL